MFTVSTGLYTVCVIIPLIWPTTACISPMIASNIGNGVGYRVRIETSMISEKV